MEESLLIEKAKKGDGEAVEKLVEIYSPIMTSIVRRYFLVGGDSEDLMQEAMIGFWNAINSYNEKDSSFKTFVTLCVTRRVQSAIRKDSAQKNRVLNYSLSVDDKEDDEVGYDMYFYFPKQPSPEEEFLDKEQNKNLKQRMKELLSAYQFEVLELYLQGHSYSEIASRFSKTNKDIDNTLMAIKRILTSLKNEDL